MPPHNSCKISFLNVCSLRKKVREVEQFIRLHNLDILAIAETWLDDSVSDGLLSVPGFQLFRRDRVGRTGGGVCCYCRETLTASRLAHLEDPHLESLVLSIKAGDKKQLTVAAYYIPPAPPRSIWDTVEHSLQAVYNSNPGHSIAVGDFNDNLMHSGGPMSLLLQRMPFRNHVTSATRVTSNTASLLDLLLASDTLVQHCLVVHADISDHFPIVAQIQLPLHHTPRHNQKFRRLRNVDWDVVMTDLVRAKLEEFEGTDIDTMIEEWYRKVFSVLDFHCPLTSPKRTVFKKRPCPWLTPELTTAVQKRNQAHRLLLRDPSNNQLRNSHRLLRTAAKRLDRQLRNRFFQDECNRSGNDPRKLWQTMNQVTGRQRSCISPKVPMQDLSDTFAAIISDPTRPLRLVPRRNEALQRPSLSIFSPVDVASIVSLCRSVDVRKSTGHDELPPIVLDRCASVLAPSIVTLFNTSLSCSSVPLAFKKANVSPLFKGGSPTIATNYRPVSLLPVLSRLLEKVVHQQMTQYLSLHSILPDSQFAYRPFHSTEDALTLATSRWLLAKRERKTTGIVFVDLSKAFDCVRHQYLLDDLSQIGVSDKVLDWFSSYLDQRVQRIKIGDDATDYVTCSRGVPQGSVLGPLLFSIYTRRLIERLPPSIWNQEFADDVMLESSDRNPSEVCGQLTAAVTALSVWFQSRGLILNKRKTQVLFLHPQAATPTDLQVKCGDDVLPIIQEAKYLGVTIDSSLSWNAHINSTIKKVRQAVGTLWRHRNSLSIRSKKVFYHSLIESKLLYGTNAFFSSLSARNKLLLIRQSKSAMRSFYGLPSWSHTSPLYSRLNVQPLGQAAAKKVAFFVHRCLGGKCSRLFRDFFTPVHGRLTRGSEQRLLEIPFWPGPSGRANIKSYGAILWNTLPPQLRLIPTQSQFRQILKCLELPGY